MKPWIDIYKDRLNNQYYEFFKKQYQPFLEQLKKYSRGINHEIGCGMGNSTRFLKEYNSSNYIDYFCYDLCPEMLSLAMKNIQSDRVLYQNINVLDISVYHLPSGLVHSHGVLEHFSDEEIKTILDKFDREFQVHYVPSDKWITPSRGDERLLSKEYWQDNFEPDEIIEFNEGKDLILIWK